MCLYICLAVFGSSLVVTHNICSRQLASHCVRILTFNCAHLHVIPDTFSLLHTQSFMTSMMPEECKEEQNAMPVKKKLKQSDEEVGVLKTCMYAWLYRVKSHIASIPAYEM